MHTNDPLLDLHGAAAVDELTQYSIYWIHVCIHAAIFMHAGAV